MKEKSLLLLALILVFCGFSQNVKADTHWLEFNPYGYRSEFFLENGVTRGSCGAAAVVIVECHLRLCSSISADAVKNKNAQMLQDLAPPLRTFLRSQGDYYISSIDGIGTRLQKDGYKVTWRGTSNRQQAAINIFDILARKHWVIVVAKWSFDTTHLGHFYPIYGGNLVRKSNGQIEENLSKLNAIEDFNSTYNPSSPNWTTMYRSIQNGNAPTVKQALDSIYSASNYGTYNIIEVYR